MLANIRNEGILKGDDLRPHVPPGRPNDLIWNLWSTLPELAKDRHYMNVLFWTMNTRLPAQLIRIFWILA